MRPFISTNRFLTFILIAMVSMIIVGSVLLLILFLSPGNKTDIFHLEITQTSNVDQTVAALVTTMLMPISTDLPNLGGTETNEMNMGTEMDQGTQDSSEVDKKPGGTFTPPVKQSTATTVTPQLTSTPDPWIESMIETMTLSQKVGQMILTGVTGTVLTTDTCQFIQRLSPGGILYLGSNISSPYPDQLASLSGDLQNCITYIDGIPLLIAIDHEGMYVTRFPSESLMTIFPPAMAFGATGNPDFAYQAAIAAGQELRNNGINMVLGPVADVLTNKNNTVISQRSYGGDPWAVSDMVGRTVQGYLAAGILPVLKHYPGHGDVSGDSHTALPVDQADLTLLFETHLIPFQKGIETGAPAVMTSHVAFPGIDPQGLPASLSSPLYQILYEDLNFQGFTISDSMTMGAIGSTGLSVDDASVKAIYAGLDMLMIISPELAELVHGRVVRAVQNGEIPSSRIDQAVSRILKVKFEHGLVSSETRIDPSPDWNKDKELAYQIGYDSIALYKDRADLVPLPADIKNILIVGPADGWGLYPLLRNSLDQRGITYNVMTYSDYWFGPIPETNYIQTVPARALDYDLVLMFTWDSHPNRFKFGDNFQVQLVNTLIERGFRLIVIALKSPTDILDFPTVLTYLSSMGTTRGQLHGIIDILLGETQPIGKIPLPGLP